MTPDARLAAIRSQVAQRPADPFARYALAMALRSAGDAEGAVAEFQELQRKVPEYVPSYLMLGQVLEGLGRDHEALATYQQGAEVAARRGEGHARSELLAAAEAARARGRTT